MCVWGGVGWRGREGPKTHPMREWKGWSTLTRGSDEYTYGSNTSQEASECQVTRRGKSNDRRNPKFLGS